MKRTNEQTNRENNQKEWSVWTPSGKPGTKNILKGGQNNILG